MAKKSKLWQKIKIMAKKINILVKNKIQNFGRKYLFFGQYRNDYKSYFLIEKWKFQITFRKSEIKNLDTCRISKFGQKSIFPGNFGRKTKVSKNERENNWFKVQ